MLAWHGIFTAVGIFFGVWLPVRLVRSRIGEDTAYAVATWGVVGGVVGARLFHVVDCWSACGYDQHPLQILAIWTGGIAIWGAAIGGVVGGFVVALRRAVPIGFVADAAAPGIGLGMAIGRIGDIINGEHHAIACSGLPWCVRYTHPDTLGQTDVVHPAVLYDMLWVLAGVALALWLRRRFAGRPPEGRIFWLFALWYAVGRFAEGFIRVGEPNGPFGLRQDQAVAVLVIAAAVPVLVALAGRARRFRAAVASP